MKNIWFLLLILPSLANSFEGCVVANLDYQGALNTMTLCNDKNGGIDIEMYFSNNLAASSSPTTCRQKAVRRQEDEGFSVVGTKGNCENGRKQPAYHLNCQNTPGGFSCVIPNIDYEIKFRKRNR